MKLATYQKIADKEPKNYIGLIISNEKDQSRYLLDLSTGVAKANLPVFPADPILFDMGTFLQDLDRSESIARSVYDWAVRQIADGNLESFITEKEVRWFPPVCSPSKIIGAGRNFLDHFEEGNSERRLRGEPEIPLPTVPAAFLKAPSSLIGHEEPISYPFETKELDYEGEIGVVIGRTAYNIEPSNAMRHIAGYVIFNDISARDIQRYEAKLGAINMAKNFPGFGPMGCELVFPDEIPDPQDLDIVTYVNGAIRQKGNTRDMHFNWNQLIAYWSKIRLEPGDIILCGTPSGVAMGRGEKWFLRKGDLVEVEVPYLGRLSNRIV